MNIYCGTSHSKFSSSERCLFFWLCERVLLPEFGTKTDSEFNQNGEMVHSLITVNVAVSRIDVCQTGDLLPPPTLQPDHIPLVLFLLFTMATIRNDASLYYIKRALKVPDCMLTSTLTQKQQALWAFLWSHCFTTFT